MTNFVVMVGVVASGKSTLSSSYKRFLEFNTGIETVVISSDAIREELLGDINDQTQNEMIFSELHRRIKDNIGDKNVIVDATNVSNKSRKALLNCVKKKECKKSCIVMTTPIAMCKERNAKRDRVVPEYVIDKQVHAFQIPFYEEGWNEIHFDNWSESKMTNFKVGWNLEKDPIYQAMIGFDQKNSHHAFTLEEHCRRMACELIRPEWKMWENKPFIRAATIHDVGKLVTGALKDDDSGDYSYYGHMNVGTYSLLQNLDLLGFNNIKDILDCLFYVNYHMEPFFWLSHNKKTGEQELSEKTQKKMKEKYGIDKYYNLLLMNYADRLASGTDRNSLEKDYKELSEIWEDRFKPVETKVKIRPKCFRNEKDKEKFKGKRRNIELTTKITTTKDEVEKNRYFGRKNFAKSNKNKNTNRDTEFKPKFKSDVRFKVKERSEFTKYQKK